MNLALNGSQKTVAFGTTGTGGTGKKWEEGQQTLEGRTAEFWDAESTGWGPWRPLARFARLLNQA